ncbi:hypothetical protein [Alkaliphilus transvaalensis]|uniref:hypothetical protein n=1 Tax=Alkaliphilus transvaalensis TaxID=114628 RepID=UPI00047A6CEB|nr:hypothetical protein [Alkaliphilus transvaalensis]
MFHQEALWGCLYYNSIVTSNIIFNPRGVLLLGGEVNIFSIIALTITTTFIGFESLYFTTQPRLSGFRLITAIEMILCFVNTIILIPALHQLIYAKNKKKSEI